MHAKLPAMMIVRKIHSSRTSAIGLTVEPVRSESNSLIVGRSVNVKIVPSTAHQTISRTKAHGTPGRREVASSIARWVSPKVSGIRKTPLTVWGIIGPPRAQLTAAARQPFRGAAKGVAGGPIVTNGTGQVKSERVVGLSGGPA